MYKLLKEYANAFSNEAARFASELVSNPSPSLCENNVARIVEREMESLGFDKVFVDGLGNVIGIMYGIDSDQTILLNSHMDTVLPEKKESAWVYPPYSAAIENHKLFGLGSADCKSGLAMQVYAAHILKKSLLPLRGNIVVAATVSEGNGLSLGVQRLISKTLPELKMKVDYTILGEPTNLGLYYGHDGWAEFKIGLDSPNPNFLYEAANIVFRNLVDVSRSNGSNHGVELMKVEEPRIDDETGTANISLNRRLFKDEDTDKLAREIREVSLQGFRQEGGRNASGFGDFDVKIKIREELQKLNNGETVQVRFLSNAWETNPFSPLMDRARQALESAGCKSEPGKWKLPQLGMGTAGSILTKTFGIATIGYGPGDENTAHLPNEYVELPNITEGILGTASIVHSLVGVPVFGWTSDIEI
ncbi:MAG: M20/M25/M40 family metallo-hydrolase [Bacteroidetes bacterium]|nr:M20/M25/M40 family metallo-hydrolase [Bacteroidota bacterium]